MLLVATPARQSSGKIRLWPRWVRKVKIWSGELININLITWWSFLIFSDNIRYQTNLWKKISFRNMFLLWLPILKGNRREQKCTYLLNPAVVYLSICLWPPRYNRTRLVHLTALLPPAPKCQISQPALLSSLMPTFQFWFSRLLRLGADPSVARPNRQMADTH